MLPLYREAIPGLNSYHLSTVVRQLATSEMATRVWHMGMTPTSVMLGRKGVVKTIDTFDAHQSEEAFMGLMEECATAGVDRPSSYSDVFHQLFYSPRIPYTVNAYFGKHFAGAWQEARSIGVVRGHLFKYDLNSAYLWSGSHGLPKPSTFRYTDVLDNRDAMYLLEIQPNPDAPFPFCRHAVVNAQLDDVELYGLRVKKILAGVSWSEMIDGNDIVKVVDRFSFAKKIARSYWGRWGSSEKVRCRTMRDGEMQKQWQMGNPVLNFIWAQLIINRVKRRVYEFEPCPHHVFVDSVITRHQLPTSNERGGWKLEAEYPNGLEFLCTGWYGEPGGELIKHAGVRVGLTALPPVNESRESLIPSGVKSNDPRWAQLRKALDGQVV